MKEFYRRNLPHYQPKDAVLFMTPRLKGSIPKVKLLALKEARLQEENRLQQLNLSNEEIQILIERNRELYFGKFDDLLDNATTGPHWLKDDRIAQIWSDALHHFDGRRYKMICSTIMSNHAHFIFYKLDRSMSEIMQSLKGFSSYAANKILVEEQPQIQKEDAFWQDETYDRSIRNRTELQHRINYTLNNPVKAGLVQRWQDWKLNYVHPDFLKYVQ